MKKVLTSVRSALIGSLVILSLIVFGFPPNTNDRLLMSSFFASLFLVTSSGATLLVYRIRVAQSNKEMVLGSIMPSIRSGLLIGGGITFILVLNTLQILTVWNALLALSILFLVELFFRGGK